MELLKLDKKLFPKQEVLEYGLKMMGAKGSVKVVTKQSENSIELKCQTLGSLVFPPKKIVDSEITTKLEVNPKYNELQLLKYIDNDYKSESRRQFEIKNHGIETRYTKFDEERGFIEIPEGMKETDLVDPLSLPFLVRDERLLKKGQSLKAYLLVRSGILNLELSPAEKKVSYIEALDAERAQTRVRAELKSRSHLKGPYLSPDLEVWVDDELGIILELSYPFLGHLGKATLQLEKYSQ